MSNLILNVNVLKNIEKENVNLCQFIFLWFLAEEKKEVKGITDETDLIIKGYLTTDCKITQKGVLLVSKILNNNKLVLTRDKFQLLHEKLQGELVKLTGKKQKKANGNYSFLCNAQDLETRLVKIIKKYNLTNWSKIENLLLKHIQESNKRNFEKVMLIEYYIFKDNSSKLATDYELIEEKEQKIEEKLVETKNLF